MLSLLFPSARRHCASARLEHWKGAASRMERRKPRASGRMVSVLPSRRISGCSASSPPAAITPPSPKARKKPVLGGAVRLFLFPRAQIQADKAAAARAHPEAQCREHRGYGKDNAHRRYGDRAQLRHKERVGHVVDRSDDAGDDAGDGERKDKPRHRCGRHTQVLCVLPFIFTDSGSP